MIRKNNTGNFHYSEASGIKAIMRTTSTYVLLLVILSGCTHLTPNPVPCPSRPILKGISTELQNQTPIEVLEIATENQIALKQYARQLEARAQCNQN